MGFFWCITQETVFWLCLTRLRDFTFTFHLHALEKEMATHSSILAWRIPGTAEPGGLPSMGSHRVEHNWSDLAAAAATTLTSNSGTHSFHISLSEVPNQWLGCVCVCEGGEVVCVCVCVCVCVFSSVHVIFQVIILKWVAISYSTGSFWPRDLGSLALAGRFFTTSATWERKATIETCPWVTQPKLWLTQSAWTKGHQINTQYTFVAMKASQMKDDIPWLSYISNNLLNKDNICT